MKRRGVTMTEILVAIFVCGFGLMALMTLFPLGALNMAQSMKDDRAAYCAANAAAELRVWWRANLEYSADNPQNSLTTNDPGAGGVTTNHKFLDLLNSGPVYLDALGKLHLPGPPGEGALVGGIIHRVTLPSINGLANEGQLANAWFTMADDWTFHRNATPVQLGAGQIGREGKFSWAYMIRKGIGATWKGDLTKLGTPPQTLDQWTNSHDLRDLEYQVVVYMGRSLSLGANYDPAGEVPLGAIFTAGTNLVQVNYGGPAKPKIRKGGFILAINPPAQDKHAFFYRVNDILNDTGAQMTLSLQSNIRGQASFGDGTLPNGMAVIMDNIVEVFDRSTLE